MLAGRVFAHQQYYQPGFQPVYNPYSPAASSDGFAAWLIFMIADSRVYELNLRERSVRVALEGTPTPIVLMGLNNPNPNMNDSAPRRLVVRTADQVVMLNNRLERLRTVGIPAEIQQDLMVFYYEFSDGRAVFHVQRPRVTDEGKCRQLLYWVNQEGQIDRTDDFVLTIGVRGGTWGIAAACPAPALASLAVVADAAVGTEGAGGFGSELAVALHRLWPYLFAIILFSSFFAWLCYRRQTRFAAPRMQRIAWSVFVWLFGVPGFIGYLFHRRWPVVDACASCANQVPMDREACSACDTAFPEPAMRGIEVFA